MIKTLGETLGWTREHAKVSRMEDSSHLNGLWKKSSGTKKETICHLWHDPYFWLFGPKRVLKEPKQDEWCVTTIYSHEWNAGTIKQLI